MQVVVMVQVVGVVGMVGRVMEGWGWGLEGVRGVAVAEVMEG